MIVALAMIVVMSLLCWAFMNTADSSLGSSFRIASDLRAFQLAESGIRHYLTLNKEWNVVRDERFELSTGTIHLTVQVEKEGQVTVRSEGESGQVRRVIVLIINQEGVVERRYEE